VGKTNQNRFKPLVGVSSVVCDLLLGVKKELSRTKGNLWGGASSTKIMRKKNHNWTAKARHSGVSRIKEFVLKRLSSATERVAIYLRAERLK